MGKRRCFQHFNVPWSIQVDVPNRWTDMGVKVERGTKLPVEISPACRNNSGSNWCKEVRTKRVKTPIKSVCLLCTVND